MKFDIAIIICVNECTCAARFAEPEHVHTSTTEINNHYGREILNFKELVVYSIIWIYICLSSSNCKSLTGILAQAHMHARNLPLRGNKNKPGTINSVL